MNCWKGWVIEGGWPLKDYGLAFAPLAPPWLLLVFAVLALAMVIAALVLRRRGALFRARGFCGFARGAERPLAGRTGA